MGVTFADQYCPSDPVTAAQMAVLIERAINGSSYNPLPGNRYSFRGSSGG
jgi:hypothetical protein